jgi:hypothetical protein
MRTGSLGIELADADGFLSFLKPHDGSIELQSFVRDLTHGSRS